MSALLCTCHCHLQKASPMVAEPTREQHQSVHGSNHSDPFLSEKVRKGLWCLQLSLVPETDCLQPGSIFSDALFSKLTTWLWGSLMLNLELIFTCLLEELVPYHISALRIIFLVQLTLTRAKLLVLDAKWFRLKCYCEGTHHRRLGECLPPLPGDLRPITDVSLGSHKTLGKFSKCALLHQ